MEDIFNKLNEKFIAYNWNKASPRSTNGITEKIKTEIIEIIKGTANQVKVEPEVKVNIARIIRLIEDEDYTVTVYEADEVNASITMSIANNAVIEFKKILIEKLSKISA